MRESKLSQSIIQLIQFFTNYYQSNHHKEFLQTFITEVIWNNAFKLLSDCYYISVYSDVLENRQVGRTFKIVNPKHKDRLEIFSKGFFLLFKQSLLRIMEYDVNRIEFVKTQMTKYVIQTIKHIFQICTDCIVHNDIFL